MVRVLGRYPRKHSWSRAGAAWVLAVLAFVVAALGRHSVVLLLAAIVALDIAIQGSNILNQARLFAISGEARSRLNTAFVACNFIGGAIGSAAASVLWSAGGWTDVTLAGATLSVFALAVWAAGRRGPLIVTPAPERRLATAAPLNDVEVSR